MLCTTPQISAINYDNYLHKGFPVPTQDVGKYTYLTMTNMDEEGYPSDSPYITEVGSDEAWKIWNDGLFMWERGDVTSMVEHSDGSDEEVGVETPISGGYGKDKHTFIVESPKWVCKEPEDHDETETSVNDL